MQRQDQHSLYLRLKPVVLFNMILLSITLAGCSVFYPDPAITAKLPKRFPDSHKDTLSVEIQELVPEEKNSDVLVTLSLPNVPIEKLYIKYGSSPDSLSNQKIYNANDLKIQDPETDFATTTVRLKDIGEIVPLYISSAVEAIGVISEYSNAVLVPE